MFVVIVKANNKNVMRIGLPETGRKENNLTKLMVPFVGRGQLLSGMKLAL